MHLAEIHNRPPAVCIVIQEGAAASAVDKRGSSVWADVGPEHFDFIKIN